ncbi:hypothetical protein BJ508DRAFT_337139, partial [Ascobolus immersus RN42]
MRSPEPHHSSESTESPKNARPFIPRFPMRNKPTRGRSGLMDFVDRNQNQSPIFGDLDGGLDEIPLESVHISDAGKKYYENLNRYTRKSTLKSSDIGTFDGTPSDLFGFVKSIEDTVDTSGVDERDIVAMLPRCLTGIASSWYNGLDHEDKKRMLRSVNIFIEALKEEYPAQTRVARKEALEFSYDPKEHSDIREYYYKKIELLRAAEPEITELDLIEEIYLGLEKNAAAIAQAVNVTSFLTLQEFKAELFFKATSIKHIVEFRKKLKKKPEEKSSRFTRRSSGRPDRTEKKTDEKKSGLKKVTRPSDLANGRPCQFCQKDHFDDKCDTEEAKKWMEKRKGRRGGK